MPAERMPLVVLTFALLTAATATAQSPPAGTPPTPANAVAATVNGQPLPEAAVQRGLRGIKPEDRAKARADILTFLIENVMIDQYLAAIKVAADPKDVDVKLAEFRDEVKKHNEDYAKVLQNLTLTEDELKVQIRGQLAWEKFVAQYSPEAALKDHFGKNVAAFDGSQVRARHILFTPGDDPKARQGAADELNKLKASMEAEVAQALAKLPADTVALDREQARQKYLDEVFAKAARERSACPSKQDGGDINYFPRSGSTVESFAAAAFALKPFEMSQPVMTEFGVHLILCTARRPGQPVKYEEIKDEVREYYSSTVLRPEVLKNMRPRSKVAIAPVK